MRKAVWTAPARDDLARVDDFYAAIDPAYADRAGRAALEAGRFLADFPLAGPIVENDLRKWCVPKTRFVIVYRVAEDGVQILRVRHGRENWLAQP